MKSGSKGPDIRKGDIIRPGAMSMERPFLMSEELKFQLRQQYLIALEYYEKNGHWHPGHFPGAAKIKEGHGVKFPDALPMTDAQVARNKQLNRIQLRNRDVETIYFRNDIARININAAIELQEWEGAIGKPYFVVHPGNAVILPHQFYTGVTKSGRPPCCEVITGKDVFSNQEWEYPDNLKLELNQ